MFTGHLYSSVKHRSYHLAFSTGLLIFFSLIYNNFYIAYIPLLVIYITNVFSIFVGFFFIKISHYEVFSWTLILNLNVIKILNLYGLYFWRPKKSFSYRKYILLNVLLFTVGSLFHMELTFFKVWGRIRYLISPIWISNCFGHN